MNGKKSKLLRQLVYGKELSIRNREYGHINLRFYKAEIKDEAHKESMMKRGFKILKEAAGKILTEFLTWNTYTQIADPRRRSYQAKKKEYLGTPRPARKGFGAGAAA